MSEPLVLPIEVDVHLDPADWSRHLAAETRRGLLDDPPWIPPVWFYDEAGSKLFDAITRLPEYYPTDAERRILQDHGQEIAALTGAGTLAELGSGTSEKTMLLLDALHEAGTLRRVVPFDVSEEVLQSAARTIAAAYPGVAVTAIVGDFHRHLDRIRPSDGPAGPHGPTLLCFLGSTIGNLDPAQRSGFLAGARATLGPDDGFLLGTDLVKDVGRLLDAYDDAAGVTAEFDLNALRVMNRELDADFEPGAFRHRAHWDPVEQRIEMHLVATEERPVRVGELDVELRLPVGSHLRTEISTKFTAEGVARELADAGFELVRTWTDPDGDFLVTLARPGPGAPPGRAAPR